MSLGGFPSTPVIGSTPAAHPRGDGHGRLDAVQVLRALAALGVLTAHALHELRQIGAAAGVAYDQRAFFPWDAGVDVFFVISGFIMVYISRGEFGRPGAPLRFMTLRILRIVPPYWFFTTLVAGLLVAAPGAFDSVRLDPRHLLASYLFLPHISRTGGDAPTFLSGWTLNYEMYFYAVFALSLSLRARAGLALLAAYLVGSVALGAALPSAAPFPLAYWTRPIVLEFLLGVLAGHAHLAGWRLRPPLAALLGLVALAGLALPHAAGLSSPEWRALDYGLPAGLLVAAGALWAGFAARGALTRGLVALGDASYVLYLSHPFTLRFASAAWRRAGLGPPLPPLASLPLAMGASVLVALLLHAAAEAPVHAFLKARALGRPVAGRRPKASAGTVP